ncbi:hypothetical protein Kpol_1028p21 [Vanderwaltozyma polyspora DSM 70294]|uniref:Zinc finger C2H2 LYAR-type domain-containing protein n=1 Tax=Vanderwaltozyma polyspora (strain ATCC 22028 / DSM 70294 / BCRC 21397 / CBS 2163 / NBRC 10782 / NRRL Y-8283 / UCD 57-17) TaxID=436907 RepID=A7TFZ1_VANPO|nr:uncharacterized protein Kpol_1028p21 [Vanderwaltozyma polyspora DSM 70294]EDO18748.1 hypothetical protein Kpol_1028p21 [Vanderwaltozyma polyspora DSM 70294]
MVTFNCEVCNETVPKKNTEKHYYRCQEAYYTCIDCSTTFDDGYSYKKHTQCISEDEKYQKALYQGKKQKGQKEQQQQQQQQQQPKSNKKQPVEEKPKETPKEDKKPSKGKESNSEKKLKLSKGESLYKIMKNMKDKDAKKKLLKSLIADEEGRLILKE